MTKFIAMNPRWKSTSGPNSAAVLVPFKKGTCPENIHEFRHKAHLHVACIVSKANGELLVNNTFQEHMAEMLSFLSIQCF